MISRGIVLKKTDAGEDNQLVTFYTRDLGKLTGIAKSVKKASSRQANHLEVFNLVDFLMIAGNGYPIAASAQSLQSFPRMKASLVRTAAGFFVLESFYSLIYEHEKDPALWNLLVRSLESLEAESLAENQISRWLTDFKKELLDVLGYASERQTESLDSFFEALGQKRFLSLEFFNYLLGSAYGKWPI